MSRVTPTELQGPCNPSDALGKKPLPSPDAEDPSNFCATKTGPATGLWCGCVCVALAEVGGGEVPVNRVMGAMGDLLENFREPIGRMQRERGMMIYPP